MANESDIILLTKAEYLIEYSDSDYIQNVLLEDRLLSRALNRLGYSCTRKSWDDKKMDWSSARAILFRATWDYFHRFDEFRPWLDHVQPLVLAINPISLIKWNMHKFYLKELNEKGIDVPPALYLEKGESRSLTELYHHCGWDKIILKPAVSGSARHTYKIDSTNLDKKSEIFNDLIAQEDMLIQEFQSTIMDRGEISLMVFGGKYSHAVLKRAKPGDFRVQDDFGGTVFSYQPTDSEIALAEKIVRQCPLPPVYARVDIFWDQNGRPLLAELEMIEPELWFRESKGAEDRLAMAVDQFLKNSNQESN